LDARSLSGSVTGIASPISFCQENMNRREDMMRHFPTLLARWRGADARLWNLTQSHPTLTILLTKDDTPGCLLVSCGSPIRIEASRYWNDADIHVEIAQDMFNVIDERADMRIFECSVEVKELERKPWEEREPTH
jgi:hypothetical protein